MNRLEGKSAIVTGAAQGLGEAIARRLAQEGCSVLIADINGEKAEAAARGIAEETGKQVIGHPVDVSDAASCTAMVDQAVRAFGKLDILIANAGILRAGDILEFEPETWKRVVDVNLCGYFVSAQA